MAISFDKALGVFPRALELNVQRAQVLANNIANADTPGFKARDFDFQAALAKAEGQADSNSLALAETEPGHMAAGGQAAGIGGSSSLPQLLYRNPSQPSLDGNTVDTQTELANYTRNAMQFQASFQFLNSRFKGLMLAVKGG